MSDIITVQEKRTLGVISMEIRTLQQQAQQVVLGYAIEIGRRLTEAKAMVSHGEWGNWLKDEVRYSKSTANNFMRIFDAYGSEQMGMFGPEAKSQTLGNLPYTKALQLLAIPEEEREEFAETNNVEELSTRELDRLIRERDTALKEKEEAEKRAAETAEKLEVAQTTQETTLAALAKAREEGEKAAEDARQEAENAGKRAEAAEKKAEKAKKAAEKAEADLKKLKENPEIPEDAMAKIRSEAEAAAQEDASRKYKAKAEELEDAAKQAKREAKEALERAEAAERKLKLTDKDLILLQEEATRLQECFNRCTGYLLKIRENDEETGKKMTNYMTAVVDAMKGRL